MTNRGKVVIVDDQDDGNKTLADSLHDNYGLDAYYRQPESLTNEDLANTQLLLVDFQLRKGWPQGADHPKPAHRVVDGLALASLLRRVLASAAVEAREPTAIALLTSHLGEVLHPLPHESRQHVVARFTNLEWAFEKGQPGLEDGIAALADAAKALPRTWGADREASLLELLGVPGGLLGEVEVAAGVRRALPPIHDIAEWSHGVAVMRWLLHRVLPYPSFLWNDLRLAAQLKVEPAWLRRHLDGALGEKLGLARYGGLLHGFTGDRWWGRAVYQVVWESTGGQPDSTERLRRLLGEWSGSEPAMLQFSDPVLALNTSLVPQDVVDASEAERVQPDDWPPHADDAWASSAVIEHDERLRAIRVKGSV